MLLYRYRRFELAQLEIENRTMRFSDRKALNDPVEGYIRVFWQGDEIAWEGLLRNYINSLYFKLIDTMISDKEISLSPMILLNVDENNRQLNENLEEIENTFLESNVVKEIIRIYGNNRIVCSRKELKYLLICIHKRAFDICVANLVNNKILHETIKDAEKEAVNANISMEGIVIKLHQFDEEKRIALLEAIVSFYDDFSDQILWRAYRDCEIIKRNWFTIRAQFPKLYIEGLEELIYPENYIVCFSTSPQKSAMWGNYADDHKGVCLIFETEEEADKHYLTINSPYSYSSGGIAHKFTKLEIKRKW